MKTIIKGSVIIPGSLSIPDCIIYIRLLDTSYADAPAEIIHELSINYSERKFKNLVPFTLQVSAKLIPQNEYSLSVHADLDNDGEISKNDLIENRNYPVRIHEDLTGDFKIKLMKIS